MNWFGKKKTPAQVSVPDTFEPVLRCSICTGEQVACLRDKGSGRLREIMLIRTPADLDLFCRDYGLKPEEIKKIY